MIYCNKKYMIFTIEPFKKYEIDFERICLKSKQYYTELPPRSKRQQITEVSVGRKTNYRRLF